MKLYTIKRKKFENCSSEKKFLSEKLTAGEKVFANFVENLTKFFSSQITLHVSMLRQRKVLKDRSLNDVVI
jgi:flagellar motor switch protein FliM